jgi:hypothetical protein
LRAGRRLQVKVAAAGPSKSRGTRNPLVDISNRKGRTERYHKTTRDKNECKNSRQARIQDRVTLGTRGEGSPRSEMKTDLQVLKQTEKNEEQRNNAKQEWARNRSCATAVGRQTQVQRGCRSLDVTDRLGDMQLVQVGDEWLEAGQWLREAMNREVLVTVVATRELRSALESWRSSVPYGCRNESVDEGRGTQDTQETCERNRKREWRSERVILARGSLGMSCPLMAERRMTLRRILVQFCGNWTESLTQAAEQAEIDQWLREATAAGIRNALDRAHAKGEALQSLLHSTAAVLRRCSGGRAGTRTDDEERKRQARKQKNVVHRGSDATAPSAPQETLELESANKLCSDTGTGKRWSARTAELQSAGLIVAHKRHTRCQLTPQAAVRVAGMMAAQTASCWFEAIAGQQRKKKKRMKRKKKIQDLGYEIEKQMAPSAPQRAEPRMRLRRSRDSVVEWEHWTKTGGG